MAVAEEWFMSVSSGFRIRARERSLVHAAKPGQNKQAYFLRAECGIGITMTTPEVQISEKTGPVECMQCRRRLGDPDATPSKAGRPRKSDRPSAPIQPIVPSARAWVRKCYSAAKGKHWTSGQLRASLVRAWGSGAPDKFEAWALHLDQWAALYPAEPFACALGCEHKVVKEFGEL